MMQAQVQQALDKIKGLPLTKTTRKEHTQYFHFGHTHYTTSQGLILDVGALVLAVDCSWQLDQKNGDPIKNSEVFSRKREAGLPSPKFDWKEPGASLRDQRLKEFVLKGESLIVNQAELQQDNSFLVNFADGSQLTVRPDQTKEQDVYWQLFSNTGDNYSITVGAAGII